MMMMMMMMNDELRDDPLILSASVSSWLHNRD